MFNSICFLTGTVIVAVALLAFKRTGDGLHPAVALSPVMLYGYSVWPLILNQDNRLEWFFSSSDLEYVSLLYLLSIAAFYFGLIANRSRARIRLQDLLKLSGLSPARSRRVYALAVVLGAIALLAYWHSLENVGGFFDAYGRAKGGGYTRSGYIGEATLLSFPAILLLAMARQRWQRIRFQDMAIAILIASPHLLQGTFGGRRGPLFLILCVLFVAWFIAKGKRPSIKSAFLAISLIGFSIIVVSSQRQHLYLGSGGEFDPSQVMQRINPDQLDQGNEYVMGIATVLTADIFENYYWGYRYFVTFVIRPIPKQIWPTKYEDMGADWLYRYGDEERGERYLDAVGFVPYGGSSTGFIADLYQEFAWVAILAAYLIGLLYSWGWRRYSNVGGVWIIIYAEMVILSVYLPTQSFSAFFHRLLFMGLITAFVWKYWVQSKLQRRTHVA